MTVVFGSVRLAALMAPLLIAMTAPAGALMLCDRLNERLASLPKVVASNEDVRDFTGAISRQNIELRRARSDRRRLGCSAGSIIVVGGDNEGACDAIDHDIAQMETNLDTLKARRLHLISGGDTEITRRRVIAALEVNRCGEETDEIVNASVEEPEFHRNILKDLPPIGQADPALRGRADITDFTVPDSDVTGRLRTMCVRTCDGAFFPISANVSPADFPRDAETCRQRCPGAETALYYHALETEEADQMISAATGAPYTDLPTAFAYKTRDLAKPGQCGCALTTTAAIHQSTPADAPDKSGNGVVILQTPKKLPAQVKTPVADRPYNPNDSKVRRVGPNFLPPQESSIDLKHPSGPEYQPVQSN